LLIFMAMEINQTFDSPTLVRGFVDPRSQLKGIIESIQLQVTLGRLDQCLVAITGSDGQPTDQVKRVGLVAASQLQAKEGCQGAFRVGSLKQRLTISLDGFGVLPQLLVKLALELKSGHGMSAFRIETPSRLEMLQSLRQMILLHPATGQLI